MRWCKRDNTAESVAAMATGFWQAPVVTRGHPPVQKRKRDYLHQPPSTPGATHETIVRTAWGVVPGHDC